MAASSVAAALFQIPAGLLVDSLKAKRLLVAASGLGAAVVNLINSREIDHDLARGGQGQDRKEAENQGRPLGWLDLFKRRDLVIFLVSVVLFHFGNAAMLPMAGQVLAKTHPGTDTLALSACIVAAQLVMIGVAWGVGRAMAKGIGRKPIFLVALATLPARGVLSSFTASPVGVVFFALLMPETRDGKAPGGGASPATA